MSNQKKPVVALITWLFARQKNINKYVALYEDLGFDCVILRPSVSEILRPQTVSKASAKKLLRELNVYKDRDIFVNAFSMGAYQLSQTLHVADSSKEFENIRPRIKAVLLDSPVDYDGVPNGIAHAVAPNNSFLRMATQFSVASLLFLAHPLITKHLIEASRRFKEEPMPVPTLVVTSENDQIASVDKIHSVIKGYEDRGVTVELLCLPVSRHVAHIVDHPALYHKTVAGFVRHHFPQLNEK